MKNLACLRSMSSTKQWVPDQEADPGTEIRSGDLYLVSADSTCKRRGARYPVHVKVYRSCYGHYAVVTASLRAPATYLNLRTCNARACQTSQESSSRTSRFRVEMGGGEGQVIYFEVSARDEGGVDEWVRAFQGLLVPTPGTISPTLSPMIPRNPIMPTLQESLEEEDEEEEEEESDLCTLGS
nr:hypothetical protein BaRGS_019580 [Batillaria attramentaria]